MRLRLTENTVTPTLKQLSQHLEVSRLLRPVGNIALAAVQRNFISGGRTQSGAVHAWPPLAETTLLSRRKGKGTGGVAPLQDTRALMNGVHPEFGSNKVAIATAGQPYDALHQFGGVTHPRVTLKMIWYMWARWQETRHEMFAAIASKAPGTRLNVKVPARPYLMLPDPEREEIKNLILQFKPAGAT